MPGSREASRKRRHRRMRRNLSGSAQRPRLLVRRTLHHIYATVVDDGQGRTILAASTLQQAVADGLQSKTNVAAAQKVGATIAQKAKEAGITSVVFDRGGLKYHGRIKALADAAREAGLEF